MVEYNQWMLYLFSVSSGIALAVIYFGGLWYTIQYFVKSSKNSHFLLIISFLIRSVVVLLGFYFIVKLGLIPILFTFLTFLIIRQLFIHRLGSVNILKAGNRYGN